MTTSTNVIISHNDSTMLHLMLHNHRCWYSIILITLAIKWQVYSVRHSGVYSSQKENDITLCILVYLMRGSLQVAPETMSCWVESRFYFVFCFLYSNCDTVILPRVGDDIKGKEQEFCPRCECKYESRNTTIIKVCILNICKNLEMLNVSIVMGET